MNESETSGNLTEYLLGGLAEHEREAIEQRSFTDDEFFLELEETEHDLIDKYVRRSLPARERMRFEKAFLTVPGRVRRVEIARQLIEHIDAKRPRARTERWWRAVVLRPWMAAAAACVILVSGAVVYFQREQPPRQQARVETPAATPPQPAPPARHEQPVEAPRATVVPAFLLAPGLLRSGGGMPIVRVGDAQNVRLQLLLESDDYRRYRVSVETPEGRSVFSRTGLGAVPLKKDRALSFTLPASALTPGDYIVRLASADEGIVSESVADYPFRAAQR